MIAGIVLRGYCVLMEGGFKEALGSGRAGGGGCVRNPEGHV